jgi:hypothetical protein
MGHARKQATEENSHLPFITVSQGAQSEIADGTYYVTLTRISDPRTVTAQRGPRAGQDVDLIDWTFAIDDGQPNAGAEIDASTSTSSGPRSKMYAFLTALFGKTPPAGTGLEKTDLIGRGAIATIRTDESGWPRIENLGAVPNTMPLPQQPAPVQPTDNTAVVKPRAAGAKVQVQPDMPF